MQTPRFDGLDSDLVSYGIKQREFHQIYMRVGIKPDKTMTKV